MRSFRLPVHQTLDFIKAAHVYCYDPLLKSIDGLQEVVKAPNTWKQRFIEAPWTQKLLTILVCTGVGAIMGDGEHFTFRNTCPFLVQMLHALCSEWPSTGVLQ